MLDQPRPESEFWGNPDEPKFHWGFVVYRTSYGDDALWERVKQKLERARVVSYELIQEQWSQQCAELSALVGVEDEARLSGKTYADVRLLFNPYWPNSRGGEEEDPDNERREIHHSLPGMPEDLGELSKLACLMIDHESMLSIDNSPPPPELGSRTPGWVWAIDCNEDYTRDSPLWDGAFMVDICAIWGALYMNVVHWSNDMTMGEVDPGPDRMYSGDY